MKIDLIKYKNLGKNILFFLGRRCWLLIVILLLIIFSTAGIVFYQYAYKVVYQEQIISVGGEKVNQNKYQKIKKNIENKQQYLQNILNKEITDPFK